MSYEKQDGKCSIFQIACDELASEGYRFDQIKLCCFITINSNAAMQFAKEDCRSIALSYRTILSKEDEYAKLRKYMELLIKNLELANVSAVHMSRKLFIWKIIECTARM